MKNKQDVLSANIGFSKYIFALSATLKLGANWSQTRYDQFVNQERLPFNNYTKSINLNFDSRIFNAITLNYQGTGTVLKSKPIVTSAARLTNSTWRIAQGLTLGYSPVSKLYLNVSGNDVQVVQTGMDKLNYLFVNAGARYRVAEWQMDISLDVNNIMNVKKYEVLYLSSNQFALNSYELRGRMALLRATFIF